MDSPNYIFCKWKSRFWPAKVLTKCKQPLTKNSKLQVEIFEENKPASVKYSDTKPFLMRELLKLSEDLDRSKNLKVTADELKYRSTLGTAMNLLKEVPVAARKSELSQDDGNAAMFEICREAVKCEGENECTSSSKIFIQKKASDSTMTDDASDSNMVDEKSTNLKRKKGCRTNKHSVCLKTSEEPKAQKHTHITDIDDIRKRRVKDTSKGQGSLPGVKRSASKTVSPPNSSSAEEHKSGKGNIKRGRFSSAKETPDVMSPVSDEDNTMKGYPRAKHQKSQPTKKDNVQIRSDREENDGHRKNKINQHSSPDVSFNESDRAVNKMALSQDDKNTATFETCTEAVKLYCTSSSKNHIQEEASNSTMTDEASGTTMVGKERTSLERKKSLRTYKQSECLNTSKQPKAQKHTHIKDIDDRRKRRVKDASKGQDSLPGGKRSAPKTVSPNSNTAEEHKSGKGNIKRGRFKSQLSSAKETQDGMSPVSDEDNTRKGNPRAKRIKSEPTKKDNVKIPSDTEELDGRRKSKYNQLPLPEFSFNESDLLSSELSMECSSPESNTNAKMWPNDDTEEDVQLPVIKLTEEPGSFESGTFVWCKFHRYPYWPSLVKLVRNKEKRASIIFLEECLSDPNSQKQSFQVSLRTLKHYDCQEKQELLEFARKDYGKSVDWCDALISDYRIRLGCGSFSGSFLEYCTSAISYPVRKECCRTKLNFPSLFPEIHEPVPDIKDNGSYMKKKILPDRARASRDRANEKLVECIIKNKQAERHLIGILAGKKKSHWLEKFQLSNQNVECLETYIEDEKQTEIVVGHLQMLCEHMAGQSKKLMNGDQTKFILEVMFPEAVIFAITATEGLSYEKAEKKFLQGPLLSKRERKLFDEQILDKKRMKLEENL